MRALSHNLMQEQSLTQHTQTQGRVIAEGADRLRGKVLSGASCKRKSVSIVTGVKTSSKRCWDCRKRSVRLPYRNASHCPASRAGCCSAMARSYYY
eukprot:2161484-Rhodomonas_salina.1